MRETKYQNLIVQRIEKEFPGSFVLKLPTDRVQGLPDLLVLYWDQWAMLEVKMSEDAPVQPNQPYYVSLFGEMSFAAFVFPEIEEEVFDALTSFFRRE